MRKKYSIIYISHIPQNEKIQWTLNTAKHLTKFAKVVHFAITDKPITFRQIPKPKNLGKIAKSLFSLLNEDFTNWTFFEIFPFKRFKFIKKLNYDFNLFLLKLFLEKNKKIIVITCSPFIEAEKFIEKIKPDLTIGDCVDGWTKKQAILTSKFTDCVLTNAESSFNLQKKYSKKVYPVPGGYFSKKLIKNINTKNFTDGESKTILFDGVICWRINPDLILFLVNKLKDFKFIFVGPELFDYDLENKGKRQRMLNKYTLKKWRILKNKPNFQFIEITNQEDIPSLNIKVNVGITPADVRHPLNRHAHPIKIYHYFSMGIPVVSTKIPSILKYRSKYVKFAENRKQFLELIKKLATKKVSPKERRKMFLLAQKQTYEEKAKAIKKIIDEETNSSISPTFF